MAPEVLEFGCVINCTSEVPFSSLLPETTARFQIDVMDLGDASEQEIMLDAFPDVCRFIHENLNSKVLVHCAEGKQRSCMVVAAYLIYTGIVHTVKDAKRIIQDHHPIAFDHGTLYHFSQALGQWESICAPIKMK